MKKFIALALSAMLALVLLVGCNDTNGGGSGSGENGDLPLRVGNPDEAVDHGFDNVEDLLDAIFAAANENLAGYNQIGGFETRVLQEEMAFGRDYTYALASLGMTVEQFYAHTVNNIQVESMVNVVAFQVTLFETSSVADASALLPLFNGFDEFWNVCVAPERVFAIRAGNYAAVFASNYVQMGAIRQGWVDVMGAAEVTIIYEGFVNDGGDDGWLDGGDEFDPDTHECGDLCYPTCMFYYRTHECTDECNAETCWIFQMNNPHVCDENCNMDNCIIYHMNNYVHECGDACEDFCPWYVHECGGDCDVDCDMAIGGMMPGF